MATTPQPMTLTVGATNIVRLRRLRHEISGVFIPTATVTFTLVDANGVPVAGVEDIPMAYAAGTLPSKGEYRGTIADAVALEAGAHYEARVTALALDGSERLFHVPCVAVRG